MPSSDHDELMDVQHRLQQAVVEVFKTHQGGSVADARAALEAKIAEMGIDPQPDRWLESTATDVAGGRRVLLNADEDRLLD